MASARLPPAQPAYVLRGHASQIHALHFYKGNLLTGDADGWLVSWSLAYKRPVAVWKGHENAVLGLATWGEDRIISHGRDNKIIIWHLTAKDESMLDKTLPIDDPHRKSAQPWILHILPVNALNFCSFAICKDQRGRLPAAEDLHKQNEDAEHHPILIAIPNTLNSDGIDIFHFPTEDRISTIPPKKKIKTGMVMALAIHSDHTSLQIAAGYESGHTMVYLQPDRNLPWQTIYTAQPHSQPVLSLALSPSTSYFLSSSADATIAKHPFSSLSPNPLDHVSDTPLKTTQTHHSGQQGLRIRSDGKIFATAGWDARVRVYSAKTMREVAVLKWHREGCYATAFAPVRESGSADGSKGDEEKGKGKAQEEGHGGLDLPDRESANTDISTALIARTRNEEDSVISTVQQRRDLKAQSTHWLAAGSKDGKVSLWDIY